MFQLDQALVDGGNGAGHRFGDRDLGNGPACEARCGRVCCACPRRPTSDAARNYSTLNFVTKCRGSSTPPGLAEAALTCSLHLRQRCRCRCRCGRARRFHDGMRGGRSRACGETPGGPADSKRGSERPVRAARRAPRGSTRVTQRSEARATADPGWPHPKRRIFPVRIKLSPFMISGARSTPRWR